ncbi:MAG: shikimate dehydrogenase [Pseudomonadota bacterium]
MTKPRLAGVLGAHIARSKSPLIHNTWLKRHAIEGLYVPLQVSDSSFAAAVAFGRETGFLGFNVTTPHKVAAYELAESRTEIAERCGSVNTLWWEGDTLCGDSTDGFGFLANLLERSPLTTASGARVVLLGAGGASLAVAAALLDADVAELRVFNRTIEKAAALAALAPDRASAHAWPPGPADLERATLLVNGTTLGMADQPPLELEWPTLSPDVVATDMIYVPLETPFLRAAAAAGATTVDGLGMLLHQARPGFERWFGERPVVDEQLRRAVLETPGYLP